MLVRIAKREDPDQTASDLGLHCLSCPFWQATDVRNFRTFTTFLLLQARKWITWKKTCLDENP